ncbi:hypothetical protein BaRGS_00006182 [Batillaria attramentaria]|uniref:Uncharacterized protein n=1 Tax=Batillaria attramentaria TaxID=370345 RepID=A0ABD0LT05_9CAEN
MQKKLREDVSNLKAEISKLQNALDIQAEENARLNDELLSFTEKSPRVFVPKVDGAYTDQVRVRGVGKKMLLHTVSDQNASHYAEQLQETESWALHKDGTSRQKVKIITTVVTTASGEQLPFGFHQVAKETGERTAESVRRELAELQMVKELATPDNAPFLQRILAKLSVLMGDRKIEPNPLQVESETVLAESETNTGQYTSSQYQEAPTELGRESVGVYRRFGKEFPAKRCARLAAGLFGPVGDEKSGCRHLWRAHCRTTGIKSLTGSYKDNRFNCLFDTCAQVFCHRQDILQFGCKISKQNLMLRSVLLDLGDARVRSMVHALALALVLITGPFWVLIHSKAVSYLELGAHVQRLKPMCSV